MSSPQKIVRDRVISQVGYVPSSDKLNKYAEYLDKTDIYNGPRTATTGTTCLRTATT